MLNHYRGPLAHGYDRLWRDFTTRMHSRVERLAEGLLFAGARVLDVGCGTGSLLASLQSIEPGIIVYGTDASGTMLRQARGRLGALASLQQWNLNDPPSAFLLAGPPFDLITCTNVIHYLREPARTLESLVRLLTPNGHLLVEDFTRHGRWWPTFEIALRTIDRQHRATLTPENLIALVSDTGVTVQVRRTFDAGGIWCGTVLLAQRQ